MNFVVLGSISILVILSTLLEAYALDEVKLLPGFQPADQRYHYPDLLLKEALEATIESHGPFKITYAPKPLVRDRALVELIKGHLVNVHVAAARSNWEKKTIPIRIPVLKGLLGYRLFLIHKDNLERLENIHDIESLKQLQAGSGSQWTTTAVLQEAGFSVVTGNNYPGLFEMLNTHRFDYFPRGVNEIFDEFESNKEKYPDLIIEPTKVLYFPTPSYFFVSPDYPDLANRIRTGLEIMIQNGTFEKLFLEKYGSAILRAKFDNREIFSIDNVLLSPETPLDRPDLWFSP